MAPLPPKQNGIFKKILKCYDYKQYKMGLKLAKQILSNPETAEHGETLAMKGLILNCMGKKDEAFEYVRRGLRNDLKSHVCWHVYGLLQRSEHKYDEAIKCYRNALKHDKDNITILRDLSLLQIQMRDLEGFRDTRYQLFMLRPAQRVSWLGFATAYHLLKDHELAIKILDEFRKTNQNQNQSANNNHSAADALTAADNGDTAPITSSDTNNKDDSDNKKVSEKSVVSQDSALNAMSNKDGHDAVSNANDGSSTVDQRTPTNYHGKSSGPGGIPSNIASMPPQVPQPIDYEQSELLLYQIFIFMEAENYKEALDYLNKYSANQICDRLAVLEYRAQLLMALNRKKEAATILRDQLIARNHENYQYYQQLEQALSLNQSDEVARLALYQEIQRQYPRSQVPFKLPLTFVNQPDRFRPIVDAYLKKSIRKGLPALFRNIKTIYNLEYDKLVTSVNSTLKQQALPLKTSPDSLLYIQTNTRGIEMRRLRKRVFDQHGTPAKIKIIEELMQNYEKNLEANNCFDGDLTTKEDTTCILWCYYYLAQHFDYLEMFDKALHYVTKAMDHTPTLIELLTIKAKIYKHKREPEKAVEFINEAQRLDTADRYLNSKCAKYFLRANKISQAEEMCSKFTRAGVPVTENLNEMQCMWFQIECALANQRLKKYGEALKKCYSIDAYFAEVNEDQFDFHTYCMRKMTLRSYVRLLRLEDVLKSHRFFFDAAEIAIKIYLQLYDEPLVDDKENDELNGKKQQLSASELKKIKNKQRKAAAKQQNQKHHHNADAPDNSQSKLQPKSVQQGKNSQNATDSNQNKATSNADNADMQSEASLEKLDAHTLEHPKDPLDMALRFLRPLKTLATSKIDTHLLAFEIYQRQDKLMLMLQSVKRAIKLDPYHEILQKQLVSFSHYVDSRLSTTAATPSSDTTKSSENPSNSVNDKVHPIQNSVEKKIMRPLVEPIRKVLELEMPAIKGHIIFYGTT